MSTFTVNGKTHSFDGDPEMPLLSYLRDIAGMTGTKFAMLPLSIQMDDHLRREKTGIIPKRLSERTPGSRTYEKGDLGYWRPRNTFVIFYRQDGLEIPGPGIVLLGKLESGAEVFDIPGPVKVDVELIR